MSLADWKAAGWLVDHEPSQDETRSLLGVIDRDLRDSAVALLSPDTQLGLAYNAALQVGTIALAAHGYRASRERKHYVTIQALALTARAWRLSRTRAAGEPRTPPSRARRNQRLRDSSPG
jgi:hypothetical protein